MPELISYRKCVCDQLQIKHAFGKGFCIVPGSLCTKFRPVKVTTKDELDKALEDFADLFDLGKK